MNREGKGVERLVGFWWRLRDGMAGRAILLLLLLAFSMATLISVVGMGASVLAIESVAGSASAINVAGSLRRLAHRAGGLVVAQSLSREDGQPAVAEAVRQFEAALRHPAVREVLAREPSSVFSSIFRGVEAAWAERIRPGLLAPAVPAADPSAPAYYAALLADVDAFAEQINTLVAVLETDAESRIEQLRLMLAVALGTFLLVVAAALFVMRRRVFLPLADLRRGAMRIARGDFAARTLIEGHDELGRVAEAFNTMAGELARAYAELERRVAEKTADLTRSNRALELLYHVITRLYYAPTSSDTYASTLRDLESTLAFEGSFVCVEAKHGGLPSVLATTIGDCAQRTADADACAHCSGREAPWSYRREGERDVLLVPLRDAERLYGMLRLALSPGRRLLEWERSLLEAVSRHMGIALGISWQNERERLLSLQEERSTIARELHDSLAQSLSFMKIQTSLLSAALQGEQPRAEAEPVLAELKEGISAAYRQLRELLATFRLSIEGDFDSLLRKTISEFAARSGMPIDLAVRLGESRLTPNQEIHVLHIVREALSNAVRHAGASRVSVTLDRVSAERARLMVEDDGIGLTQPPDGDVHHFGLTIMGERARGLGGRIDIETPAGGGTRVVVCFAPGASEPLRAESSPIGWP